MVFCRNEQVGRSGESVSISPSFPLPFTILRAVETDSGEDLIRSLLLDVDFDGVLYTRNTSLEYIMKNTSRQDKG